MKSTAELKFTAILGGTLLVISNALASFEPLPVGGRAAGMGEAYSAVADDVFSLYYNPAGVLQMPRPELGSYYSQLYPGLTDNSQISRTFLGYAQPFGKEGRMGGIGASYLALNLQGLYKEETMGVTYGYEYRRALNLGVSLKLLRKQIGSDSFTNNAINPVTGAATGAADPLLAKSHTATAIALDLGLQYRLSRVYALGFSARNVNAPNVAIGSGSDQAPAVFAAALARRMRAGSLDVEVSQWKTASDNLRLSLGGEHWFKSGFGLRAGGGLGSRNYATASFGASYKMDSIQFDYATVLPLEGIQGTWGDQQISLIVRLGKPPVDPLEQQLVKEKEERIRAETEARYAKAERDRLKSQLYALTEAKTQAEQELEKRSAQKALEEAQNQESQAAKAAAREKANQNRSLFNVYTTALADYNQKVSQGIGILEKRTILEKIQDDFTGKGIDLSTVIRELKNLKVEEGKAKRDFELSMNFYRRLVQQGASVDERKGMLDRIVQKYKGTGVDISPAEEEIKSLK